VRAIAQASLLLVADTFLCLIAVLPVVMWLMR
jgi:hypothetical protein